MTRVINAHARSPRWGGCGEWDHRLPPTRSCCRIMSFVLILSGCYRAGARAVKYLLLPCREIPRTDEKQPQNDELSVPSVSANPDPGAVVMSGRFRDEGNILDANTAEVLYWRAAVPKHWVADQYQSVGHLAPGHTQRLNNLQYFAI